MYFIGAFIMLAGVTLVCLFRGVPFGVFLNPAAILVIFLVIIGVIVSTSGFKTFVRGLNAILSPSYVISEEERHNAAELYRLLSKSVLLAAFIALLIGVMAALSDISDVDRVTHAFVSALVSPTFALILIFAFFEPAIYILKKPRRSAPATGEYSQDLGERLLELCSQNGLTPEDIKNATAIELKQD